MKKYQYQILHVDQDRYETVRDANSRMEQMAELGWEFYDWKMKRGYTFLLFRKEVTNESNTE